ncbi:hypothetical protein [Bartonella sp. B39]
MNLRTTQQLLLQCLLPAQRRTQDQAKADISIHFGGNIVIKGAQEKFNQQQQSSESGFFHEKSSNK